jgi:hypothetical protein
VKNSHRYLLFLSALATLALGCDQKEQPNSVTPTVKKEALDTIITLQAKPDERRTPLQTAIHELEWKYKSGHLRHASAQDVVLDSSLNNFGLVSVRVPLLAEIRYNTLLLNKTKDGTWIITGLIDFPYSANDAGARGLKLPTKKYSMTTSAFKSVNESDGSTWVFEDDQHVVVLTVKPLESIDTGGWSHLSLKPDRDAWIRTQSGATSLVYVDEGKIMLINTNVGPEQATEFAESLPYVTSAFFPFNS